jgi:hypothetical protein
MPSTIVLTGLLGSLALAATASDRTVTPAAHPGSSASVCATTAGPEYYAFELYTTRNIPGTGLAKGIAEVSISGSSPFSVALGPDGSYVYDVAVSIDRMKVPRQGRLVAWVTTPDIDRIERMAALDDNLRASGSVSWNKFIVVVTLEPGDDPSATTWSGPVVFRGMSRSGMMHTMVGHGALQQENCAAYGYGN